MNAEIFKGILDIVMSLIAVVLFSLGVLFGYWMGRNSAERPFVQQTTVNKTVDQGPKDDEGAGDIFIEAQTAPDHPDQEKGIPTIIGDERLPG